MKIAIWKIPFGFLTFPGLPFSIEEKGYLEMESFDEDECWHQCNWSCWGEFVKPDFLHSDVAVANADIIFHDPSRDKYFLALPGGWHEEDTLEKIVAFCQSYWENKETA